MALSLIHQNRPFKIFSGISEKQEKAYEDLKHLYEETEGFKYTNKEIKLFKSWDHFVEMTESERVKYKNKEEWVEKLNYIQKRAEGDPSRAHHEIKSIHLISESNKNRTDIDTIITGHKSKGLEWDFVQVCDDFELFFKKKEFILDSHENPVLDNWGKPKYRILLNINIINKIF